MCPYGHLSRKSAGHRGWQDVLLLFSTRTVVTCFPSNRTIFLVLALAKLIQHTAHLGLPIPMLCLPPCPRRAYILKGMHLVYAKLLPSGFPILIFLLLRIECMSFVFYSPNNPKRPSSLNPVVARVAQRFWRKKSYISPLPKKSQTIHETKTCEDCGPGPSDRGALLAPLSPSARVGCEKWGKHVETWGRNVET